MIMKSVFVEFSRAAYSSLMLRAIIIDRIAQGRGDETLMIASPNDPIEKVPNMLWYEEDGIPKFNVVWEKSYNYPIKTFYEWARELKIEV